MDSILLSTKKMLGIDPSYTHFDADIIIHINTVLMILRQIGIGPKDGFVVYDEGAGWDEITGDTKLLESVKSYVFMKVKTLFDPPQSNVASAYEKLLAELEYRLYVESDNMAMQEGKNE